MADKTFYEDKTNVLMQRSVFFKFFPDAGNQPTLAASPANLYISTIVWVSQGLYRITLLDTYRNHVSTKPHINVSAAGVARWAQPGPVANVGTSTPVTVDILIVDNAGAVQNPAAANANNFISGEIVFADTAAT